MILLDFMDYWYTNEVFRTWFERLSQLSPPPIFYYLLLLQQIFFKRCTISKIVLDSSHIRQKGSSLFCIWSLKTREVTCSRSFGMSFRAGVLDHLTCLILFPQQY